MADAQLSVEIAADIRRVISGMREASQAVQTGANSINASTNSATRSFTLLNQTRFDFGNNLQRASQQATTATRALAQQAQTTSAIMGGSVTSGANRAGAALTDFGRIAQDLPYGFIGIQNNLNPMLESFQRLRAETGSIGGAFKALGQSLIGPAGIGIALSLVSAGILLYQKYMQSAGKATKETKDELEGLASSAAKETAKITILYDATQNLNIPLAERKQIVDELQRQYPAYFGNLTDEAILAGKASRAYDSLTQSLINNAVAKGGEDAIASQVKALATELIAFQQAQIKYSQQTGGKGFLAKNNSFVVDKNGDLEALNQYESRVKKEIADTRKAIQGVLGNFSAVDIIGNFTQKPDKIKKSVDNYVEEIKEVKSQILKATTTGSLSAPGDLMERQQDAFVPFGYQDSFDKYLNSVSEFEGGIKDIGGQAVETVGNFFSSLGEAFASGDFSNLGQDILQAFAGFLNQLGQMFIKQGVAEIAFGIAKNFILPGSGATNIAGGAGMIAAGAALSLAGGLASGSARGGRGGSSGSGSKPIPQFANGTNYAPGGMSLVGERGPELVNLPRGSQVIPNHKISGYGGGNNVMLNGNLELSLDKLYFALERTGRKIARTS